jgi:ComF family protein
MSDGRDDTATYRHRATPEGRAGRWFQAAVDFLVPPRCVACGRRGSLVCAACQASIRASGPLVCPRCARPSLEGRICPNCRGRSWAVRGIVAAHAYEGVVRAAILALKYQRQTRVSQYLGGLILGPIRLRPLDVDLVVPVPLSRPRLRQRGFNQSELLARPVAAFLNRPLAIDALVRTRDTQQQTRLRAAERRRNVDGAFAVPKAGLVDGLGILLVDDVCTTGATLDSCGAALQEAGAGRIWALVLARES